MSDNVSVSTLVAISQMRSIELSTLFSDMGLNSSVGIAIRYGLDGPGIEDFPHPSRPALRPTQHLIQWVSSPFRE